MNLAQAVSVCLYEFHKTLRKTNIEQTTNKKIAENKTVELMFQHMRQTLLDIEYLNPQNPDHILRSFRRIFGRAQLTDHEVQILQGVWSRIDWIEDQRRKGILKN